MKTNNTSLEQIIFLMESENHKQQIIIAIMLVTIMFLVIMLIHYRSKYKSVYNELFRIKLDRIPPSPRTLIRNAEGKIVVAKKSDLDKENNG